MNSDTIRGQQDAYKRWRDEVIQNPMRGATELPYIKPGWNSHRHKETFSKPVVKKVADEVICCECESKMRLVIDEFYCERCHSSVIAREIV